jgi:hypothetical protein
MVRRLVPLLVVVLALTVLCSPSSAGPYDLIVADGVDVTLCEGCGIMLAELGYALLVNTGSKDITIADLRGATFTVTSSRPDIELYPIINIPNEDLVGRIQPGEAVGSIYPGNEILLSLVRPEENVRNLGHQFMAFQVERRSSTYEGPVDFNVHLALAGYEVDYAIHVEAHLGQHSIGFLTAKRVGRMTAVPMEVTPVRATTWGAIKRIYR